MTEKKSPPLTARRWYFFAPLLILLGLLGLLAYGGGTSFPLRPALQRVPDFSLPALDPTHAPGFSTAQLREGRQPVLVNVWASWCAPCRAEHPHLMALARTPGLRLVGIAYKDSRENARHFLARFGNPFHFSAMDESGEAMLHWGLFGVPETFLLTPEGEVLLRHFGPLTRESLARDILPALAAAKADAAAQSPFRRRALTNAPLRRP